MNQRICGPDVTQWFIKDIERWVLFAVDLSQLAKKWGKDAFSPYAAMDYQIDLLTKVARQITYEPNTAFTSISGKCTANCNETVTLCGGCIHRSELGNFIYGAIARSMGMRWRLVQLGSIFGNRGKRTDSDKASVYLGYFFIDEMEKKFRTSLKAPWDLCAFLNINKNRNMWVDMLKDGHGCSPCPSSIVPANAPGTLFPNITNLKPSDTFIVTVPTQVTGP